MGTQCYLTWTTLGFITTIAPPGEDITTDGDEGMGVSNDDDDEEDDGDGESTDKNFSMADAGDDLDFPASRISLKLFLCMRSSTVS